MNPSNSEKLTKAQLRVLRDLAGGGCFFAALRRSADFGRDGVLFSERVGIVVHRPGYEPKEQYRVRNHTVAPLYLATPPLVLDDAHGENGGGWRSYSITPAGRSLLSKETGQ